MTKLTKQQFIKKDIKRLEKLNFKDAVWTNEHNWIFIYKLNLKQVAYINYLCKTNRVEQAIKYYKRTLRIIVKLKLGA